jgi:hypothetical protein
MEDLELDTMTKKESLLFMVLIILELDMLDQLDQLVTDHILIPQELEEHMEDMVQDSKECMDIQVNSLVVDTQVMVSLATLVNIQDSSQEMPLTDVSMLPLQ